MNLVTQIDTKNLIVTFQFRGHSISASFRPEVDEGEYADNIDSCLTNWIYNTFDEDVERWLEVILRGIVKQLRKDAAYVTNSF